MTSSFGDQVERRQEQLRRTRVEIADLKERLATAHSSVTSKNREITVMVNSHGELLDIKFRTGAYRSMSPVELSKLLRNTIEEARNKAKNVLMDEFAKVLPDMPIRELMNGELDFAALMRKRIGLPDDSQDGSGAGLESAGAVDR